MFLKELHLHNYRGHRSLDITLSPHINLLFGVNGAGKSSVLDACSHVLSYFLAKLSGKNASGTTIKEEEISQGERSSYIQATLDDGDIDYTLLLCSTRKGHIKEKESILREATAWAMPYMNQRSQSVPVSYPLLAHYKVNRAIIDIPQRQARIRDIEEPLTGYEQALDGGGNFRSFFAWFREMEDIENERRGHDGDSSYRAPELQAVRKALGIVLPGIKNIHIRRIHQAMVGEKNGVEISVAQLSDGEKCYMALVGDIASRLARLNVQMQLAADEILRSRGIVLIDELDLHLHPQWQQEAIRKLPTIFPNIQFIITTHSLVLTRELDMMQEEPDFSEKNIKFFSLYGDVEHASTIEEAENLASLQHFPAADLHLQQDIKLLNRFGYELP